MLFPILETIQPPLRLDSQQETIDRSLSTAYKCGYVGRIFSNFGPNQFLSLEALLLLSPKSVWLFDRLPELDGPVLAAGAVELAIGGVAYGPDRAVVTFLDLWIREE